MKTLRALQPCIRLQQIHIFSFPSASFSFGGFLAVFSLSVLHCPIFTGFIKYVDCFRDVSSGRRLYSYSLSCSGTYHMYICTYVRCHISMLDSCLINVSFVAYYSVLIIDRGRNVPPAGGSTVLVFRLSVTCICMYVRCHVTYILIACLIFAWFMY